MDASSDYLPITQSVVTKRRRTLLMSLISSNIVSTNSSSVSLRNEPKKMGLGRIGMAVFWLLKGSLMFFGKMTSKPRPMVRNSAIRKIENRSIRGGLRLVIVFRLVDKIVMTTATMLMRMLAF